MNSRFTWSPIAALIVTLALGTSSAAAQAAGTGSTATGPASKATTQSGANAAGTAPGTRATRDASPPMAGTRSAGTASAASQQNWERTHRASKIIGMDVLNRQGEKVGDVEDIVLDQKGNVAYAVVSTGGFLGIGERLHAVPWQSLQTNPGSDKFVLDVDKDRLRAAPGFDHNNFPNVNDPNWSSENRKYFPQASATGSDAAATRMQRGKDATAGSAARSGSTAGDVRRALTDAPRESRPPAPGPSNTDGTPVANQPGTSGGMGNPPAAGGGTGTAK